MDALELLTEDHRKVAELFERVEGAKNEAEKDRLFEKIRTELEAHTHIEETIFYPALEQEDELRELMLEAIEEHKQVKTLLREIPKLAEGSEKFDAKLKVMKENIEHHVDEEENEMFPLVREIFSENELNELGLEMEAAKQEFNKKGRSTSTGSRR